MTKIDIISGFLGAGKTTFIKKLLKDAFEGEQVVLIENEFGEISIDGGFLKDAGVEIREMSQGCICCSLVGDFSASLKEVVDTYKPDRIIIEPSGVGKLSDVIKAVDSVAGNCGLTLNSTVTVVDAMKCKMYMKNFGEFFNNQVESAATVILSRTDVAPEEKVKVAVDMIKNLNPKANVVTTPVDKLGGKRLLELMENGSHLEEDLIHELLEKDEHHHDHEHEHHHDHEHGEECTCGCHDHDHDHHDHEHHHHHHADEVFESIGKETLKKFNKAELESILDKLANDSDDFGVILRSKGMLPSSESEEWFYFDLTPGEFEIRSGAPEFTGKVVVIGSKLDKHELLELFGIE